MCLNVKVKVICRMESSLSLLTVRPILLQVHLVSSFIMNGVCVKWLGWLDLETLTGKARLVFDDEHAKVWYCIPIPHGNMQILIVSRFA